MKNKSNVEKRVSKVKKILRWKISLPEPGFEPTTFWSTSSCRHCFLLMVAGLLLSHQVAQTRSQYPGGPCSGHQQATSAKTRAFPGPVHPAELPTICWTKYLLRAFISYIGTSCALVGSNQQSWKFGEKNCPKAVEFQTAKTFQFLASVSAFLFSDSRSERLFFKFDNTCCSRCRSVGKASWIKVLQRSAIEPTWVWFL